VALGCGGGGTKQTEQPEAPAPVVENAEPEPEPEPPAAPLANGTITGAEACDELAVMQHCFARGAPEKEQEVRDRTQARKDAIADEASREMTIYACDQEVRKSREAAAAVGCESPTGAVACDALLTLSRCLAKDVPEAVKAVEDSGKAWRDALSNEASRQMTIDACAQALGQMNEAAASVGCQL
jgi:hypothetical protein